MRTVCKLTDQNLCTMGTFQWVVGEWKDVTAESPGSVKGWLHCYYDPYLGLLLNPVHAHIERPRVWRAEAEGRFREHDRTKWCFSRMRLVEEIFPRLTDYRRLHFAALCATPGTESERLLRKANNATGDALAYFVARSVQAAARCGSLNLVSLAKELWDGYA